MHSFLFFSSFGIYTIPEISSCRYTKKERKAFSFCCRRGQAYYEEIARNPPIGNDPGLGKKLFLTEI